MADDKPVTPEQQLLKLIEESNKSPKGAPSPGAPGGAAKRAGGFSFAKMPGLLAGRLSFWKRNAGKRPAGGSRMSVDIASLNKIFTVAVGCLLVYVVFDAAASARNLQRPPNFVPPKDLRTALVKEPEAVEPLKESSYYLQKVSARDIFREGKKEVSAPSEAPKNAVVETADAVKNLALVGISWSANPDAIIEDKAHQRTFFVKRGEMVGDDVKVEAIFKDHVVVTFEDHEYELR